MKKVKAWGTGKAKPSPPPFGLVFDEYVRKDPQVLRLEDLVHEVEAVTELGHEVSQLIVLTIFREMKHALLRRETIVVRGWGYMKPTWRKASRRVNFGRTGYVALPARSDVLFRPCEATRQVLAAQDAAAAESERYAD